MPDRLVVVDSRGVPSNETLIVWYVSDGEMYSKENDPYEMSEGEKDRIVRDIKIDGTLFPGEILIAFAAVAGLDAAAGDQFRDMLSYTFEAGMKMGMEYQQELDRKALEAHNHDIANGSR